MPRYPIRLSTHTGFVDVPFEADTPQAALTMAQEWVRNNDFSHRDVDVHDYHRDYPVEEIESRGMDGETLAIWRSDDVRLHMAAGQLLAALQTPELDAAHEKLSALLKQDHRENAALSMHAAMDLCAALHAHHEKRSAAIATATQGKGE
jgi:hypothetical protein